MNSKQKLIPNGPAHLAHKVSRGCHAGLRAMGVGAPASTPQWIGYLLKYRVFLFKLKCPQPVAKQLGGPDDIIAQLHQFP